MAEKKYNFTYKTICLTTGKFYIGVHSTDDMDDGYLGSGHVLVHSFCKHGRSNHVRTILEHFPTRGAAIEREKELITPELIKNRSCLNIAPGGGGGRWPGFKHSEEARRNIGQNNRSGEIEVRQKIAATLTGRKNPEHSLRQLKRFSDKGNHPRIKQLFLISPESAIFEALGFEHLTKICKEKNLSIQRLLKFKGFLVPSPVDKRGAREVTFNTTGWMLK